MHPSTLQIDALLVEASRTSRNGFKLKFMFRADYELFDKTSLQMQEKQNLLLQLAEAAQKINIDKLPLSACKRYFYATAPPYLKCYDEGKLTSTVKLCSHMTRASIKVKTYDYTRPDGLQASAVVINCTAMASK